MSVGENEAARQDVSRSDDVAQETGASGPDPDVTPSPTGDLGPGRSPLDVTDPLVAGAALGTDGGGIGLARGIEALEGSSWARLEQEAATGDDGEVEPDAPPGQRVG